MVNEYDEQGYLSINNAYSADHIRRIIDILAVNKVFDYDQPKPVYNLLKAFPIISELITTNPLQDIIECLLGE